MSHELKLQPFCENCDVFEVSDKERALKDDSGKTYAIHHEISCKYYKACFSIYNFALKKLKEDPNSL